MRNACANTHAIATATASQEPCHAAVPFDAECLMLDFVLYAEPVQERHDTEHTVHVNAFCAWIQ